MSADACPVCGVDLSGWPPEVVYGMGGGIAMEMRHCASCGGTRSVRKPDMTGEMIRLWTTTCSVGAWSDVWEALDALTREDPETGAVVASAPVWSCLERAGAIVAVVVPAWGGVWYFPPPGELEARDA